MTYFGHPDNRLLSVSCRVGDLSLSISCRVGEYFLSVSFCLRVDSVGELSYNELIQDGIVVLLTRKNVEDLIKNQGARVRT